MNNDNCVNLVGTIYSTFTFDHEAYGEKFYMFYITSTRTSGYQDVLPVIISSRLINVNTDMTGIKVEINGTYRSFYRHEEEKTFHLLYVFAERISETDKEDEDSISLTGFICKPPTYRKTPNGREISDIMLCVNRAYGKKDYIPVIAWSRNAIYMSQLPVSSKVAVLGRIQSRDYLKAIGDNRETRTAYEVSASLIEVCRAAGGGSYDCDGEEPGQA